MLEATLQKTRGVLQKSFKELPIAKDLPRLASRIRVEDADGHSLLPPAKEGATPLDHLFNLFRTLYMVVDGDEETKKMERAFAEHFENTAVVEKIMENKLESFIAKNLGGDDGRVIRLLKSCNQSAIAGAIIELKVTLGTTNVTKDVANSWFFVITFGSEDIIVRNRKKEQSVDGVFTFEWILSFTYDRKITGCKDIALKVMDLTFNPSVTPEKAEEVRKLLDKYLDKTATVRSPRSGTISSASPHQAGSGTSSAEHSMIAGTTSFGVEDPNASSNIDLLQGETILFRDKNATHVHVLGNAAGTVYVTNYRVVFDTDNKRAPALDGVARYRSSLLISAACTEVPLTYIVNIKKKSQRVDLWCKDLRIVRIQFPSGMKSTSLLFDAIQKAVPSQLAQTFAFAFATKANPSTLISPREKENWYNCLSPSSSSNSDFAVFDISAEFKRLKVSADRWRISLANVDYTLCSSLASTLVVPKNVSDAELQTITEAHTRKRLPIFTWRSPQNAVLLRAGAFLHSRTSEAEEKFLRDLVESNPNRSLFILEVHHDKQPKQPKLPDSFAQTVKFEQLELPNMSLMQTSFQRLAKALHQSTRQNDASDWLVAVNDSKWLHQLQELLVQALKVVDHLERGRAVMLVDSADISDRIPQLSSLAQVMMDPYYRTIVGFGTLIEKEWIAYGHPFQSRCGHLSRGVPSPSEHAPVFLQFIDAVFQLMDQFPSAFEFSSALLLELMHQVYACMYGNFLGNTEQERKLLTKFTVSIWSKILWSPELKNISFHPLKIRVLIPSTNFKRIRLWTEYYCRSDPDMQGVHSFEVRQGVPSVGYDHTDLQKAQEANDDLQAENKRLQARIDSLTTELAARSSTSGSPTNSVSKHSGERLLLSKTSSSSMLGGSPKKSSPLSIRPGSDHLSPQSEALGQSNSSTTLHNLYNQSGSTNSNPMAVAVAQNNARRTLASGWGAPSSGLSNSADTRDSQTGTNNSSAPSGKGILVRTGSSPDIAKHTKVTMQAPATLQPRDIAALSHASAGTTSSATSVGDSPSLSGHSTPPQTTNTSSPRQYSSSSNHQSRSHSQPDSPAKGNSGNHHQFSNALTSDAPPPSSSKKDKKDKKEKDKKEKKRRESVAEDAAPYAASGGTEPSPRGYHAAPRVPRPRDVGSTNSSTDPSPAGSLVMASRVTVATSTAPSVATGRPTNSVEIFPTTKSRSTEDPTTTSSTAISNTNTPARERTGSKVKKPAN